MIFDPKKNKAIIDRAFTIQKLAFIKNANYDLVLETITNFAWPPESRDADATTFYVADGSGVSIESDEFILKNEEKSVTLPWTLENYVKICHKFPSKTRLYSVRRDKGTYNILYSCIDTT